MASRSITSDLETHSAEYFAWPQRFIGPASCFLLFLCMAFPTVLTLVPLKSSILSALLIGIILEYLSNPRSCLHYQIVLWTLGLSVVGFLYVIKGILAGNPGATAAITVYIIWPIAFTCWIAGIARARLLSAVHRTIIAATLFIALYGCLFLLTELKVLPDIGLVSTLSLGWEVQAFGAHEGYTQMAIAGMNSLPFLVPYVMASVAIPSSWLVPGRRSKSFLWITCLLSWFTVLAAGRRALLLVMFVSPLSILFFWLLQPRAEKAAGRRSIFTFLLVFAAAVAILLGALTVIYDFDLPSLWSRFADGFNLSSQSGDEDAVERHQQLIALSHGWLQKPLFGAGLGASVMGSIRSGKHAMGVRTLLSGAFVSNRPGRLFGLRCRNCLDIRARH